MRISVIIPCHNAARWIINCIRSVAAQSVSPHEIIIIDDNSADDSVRQIRSCGVPVKLLHAKYQNAAAARNLGVENATGDWLAFLDADDVWYPFHLERASKLLEKSNDVAYFSMMDDGYLDGRIIRAINRWPVSKPTTGLTHQQCIQFWVTHRAWQMITMVVNRERFAKVGGFDIEQRSGHDFEMWLRLIHNHTWCYDPTATARRLLTSGSVSRSNHVRVANFVLNGLLKNRQNYASREYDILIQQFARQTASFILLFGSPSENAAEFALARSHLERLERITFGLCRACPAFYRLAHVVRSKIRFSKTSKPRTIA